MGLGEYSDAVDYFGRAAALSSTFSFATANRCVALFAAGRTDEAVREMRALLRKYPDYPDTRAVRAVLAPPAAQKPREAVPVGAC